MAKELSKLTSSLIVCPFSSRNLPEQVMLEDRCIVNWEHCPLDLTELGTWQFFSFATTTTQQRNRASRTSQGPEKIRKIVRPQCLDGVATTKIVKWQIQTTLCPENMVPLSRQNCRVLSSGTWKCPFFCWTLFSICKQAQFLQKKQACQNKYIYRRDIFYILPSGSFLCK